MFVFRTWYHKTTKLNNVRRVCFKYKIFCQLKFQNILIIKLNKISIRISIDMLPDSENLKALKIKLILNDKLGN